jgi:hypothetical protein
MQYRYRMQMLHGTASTGYHSLPNIVAPLAHHDPASVVGLMVNAAGAGADGSPFSVSILPFDRHFG